MVSSSFRSMLLLPQFPAMNSMSTALIFFTLSLPLIAAASPPSHYNRHHLNLRNSTDPPREYVEITRPLPFDSLVPSCTLPVFAGNFSNSVGYPPTNVYYAPPVNCTWTNVVLHLSAASNGTQYDRISAVWLAGAEILRTSTPEPSPEGTFWNVSKDVTKYSSLLRQTNLTLSVMLENIVNDVFSGVYHLNLTFLYYNVNGNGTEVPIAGVSLSMLPPHRKSTPAMLKMNYTEDSLDLNKNPADLIVPVNANGKEGFWFIINNESDVKQKSIQIPQNIYRAVIEVYVSFHGDDEFWYSNPPDAYLSINGLSSRRGHGSFREVVATIDNNVVGSAIPFPVIFTGGVNPLFWNPVVSIGAFDLPSYEIELTPFLGILLDGKSHSFGLSVADSISFWLIDANLHLWVDKNADKVQAKPVRFSNPSSCVEREFRFQDLDGRFKVESERESEFSGWVNSTAGNFTTHVSTKLEFENSIQFKNNGTEKTVEQEVKVRKQFQIISDTGIRIVSIKEEKKYPLKLTSSTVPGSQQNTSTTTINLEHSITETKSNGSSTSTFVNSQTSQGWMSVEDHNVLSGSATTSQNYAARDSVGCYSRVVSAADGYIKNDVVSSICNSKL